MTFKVTAPRNKLEQTLSNTAQEAGQPVNEQERISYGIITEVNEDTSQVKIRLLRGDGELGDEIQSFFPLINPLPDIHLMYGALRAGLIVRLYWKGKLVPTTGLVEVIADEDHSFLKKQPIPNELELGPWKIFSGGLGF